MSFSFAKFNKEFLFELPSSITGVYLKPVEAEEKYGEGIIPVIGYGVSTNKSPNAVSAENAWIATDEEFINVPLFQLPEIQAMMEDRNAVSLTKQGKLGAQIVHYTNQYGDQIKFKWVDRK